MAYFCLIESSDAPEPRRAPLLADSLEEAISETRVLLDQHGGAFVAHIHDGDQRVASVRRPERSLATKHPPL